MSDAIVRALGDEVDARRPEALMRLRAESRRVESPGGFRDAPEMTRHLVAASVHTILTPTWRTPFLDPTEEARGKPLTTFGVVWRMTLWGGVCAGWWIFVGQDLLAMFQ